MPKNLPADGQIEHTPEISHPVSRRTLVFRSLFIASIIGGIPVTGATLSTAPEFFLPETLDGEEYIIMERANTYTLLEVGDSLSRGICGQHTDDVSGPYDAENIGWIPQVCHLLTQHEMNVIIAPIDTLAEHGLTSTILLQRIIQAQEQNLFDGVVRPVFCLSIGGNDLLELLTHIGNGEVSGLGILGAAIQTYRRYKANMREIVTRLLSIAPSGQVLAVTIPDITQIPQVRNRVQGNPFAIGIIRDLITAFNNVSIHLAKDIHAATRRRIGIAETGGIIHADMICQDGLHPNAQGYANIAHSAFRSIHLLQ